MQRCCWGKCERSFRRHVERYKADGLEGLLDKRLSQVSKRRAGAAEIDQVVQTYKSGFAGWNVAHFHSKYRSEFKGTRSYSWVKTVLQGAGLVKAAKRRGKHRIKRERAPLAGMMVHQDASTHRWVPGQVWDLVVTLDDATGEHTSMFFCDQEGTASSFHGLGQTDCALRPVRQPVHRPRQPLLPHAAGRRQGRKQQLTEVGRALKQLGIEHIAAYSPEARGRSERAFQTHQGRLPQELARARITDMQAANHYLEHLYRHSHNREFGVASSCLARPMCRFSAAACPISCASTMSAGWATTTA